MIYILSDGVKNKNLFRSLNIISFWLQTRAYKIQTAIRQIVSIVYQMVNVENLISNIVTQRFVEKVMGIATPQTHALLVWYVERITFLTFIHYWNPAPEHQYPKYA